MGDGLPEKLYTAWRSSQPDPTAHPSWGNLESEQRQAWEAVAIVARTDAEAKQNDEIAMLRGANAAWQRTCAELTAMIEGAGPMTRGQFVVAVLALLKRGDDSQARELGEALIGMGANLLDQAGVMREDLHAAIDRVPPPGSVGRLS